jgi:hypothetical protein
VITSPARAAIALLLAAATTLLVAACSDRVEAGSSASARRSAEPASSTTAAASVELSGRSRAWPGPPASASFPGEGVKKVVLRSGAAGDVKVEPSKDGTISVSGTPVLVGIEGGPSEGAFDKVGFASVRFEDTLLVASKGEFFYIHFGTRLTNLVIRVPEGVPVSQERLVINGDLEPDLRPPGAPPRPEGR